jgi:hypothetical protein
MRYDDFVARYPRELAQPPSRGSAPDAAVREAASWSHALGVRLHDHLSGADGQHGAGQAEVFEHYTRWASTPGASGARLRAALAGGDDDARAMHFHALAGAVLPVWRWLYGAGPIPTVADGRRTQMLLALHAARLIEHRRRVAGSGVRDDGRRRVILRRQNDSLSEADTALVIVEALRARASAFVVPAPPQFRAGAPGTAVDLLVLDAGSRAVSGVRVVTGLTRSERARMHRREGVELVDGAVDLANERLAPIAPGSSTRALTAWPGLVSGHFLLREDTRHDVVAGWRTLIEQGRHGLADELHGTTDPLARAALGLRRRILGSLDPHHPAPG